MTLKTGIIPCLDVKDANDARSGKAARTRHDERMEAVL